MPYPKSTIIISVYKDTEALGLILDSLANQTYPPDQIIISEDGNSKEMATFISSYSKHFQNLLHLTQSDEGWRKNRALNRSIAASTGKYLIFIDGDCVPYPQFVEEHLKLQEENYVLCGRRTEPGERFSTLLRKRQLSVKNFTNRYLLYFFALKRDQVRHYDDGIYFGSESILFNLIRGSKKKENHIVGCNFSCYKSDMIRINGFDEDFILPTTGEDTDIERRMRLLDIKMKSCRNAANLIHLDHPKVFSPEISSQTLTMMQQKGNISFCLKGLNQYINAGYSE
ncbi:MAG: glycosyl transferase family 2 [Sulfuricurvum sp. PD_MW2]|jgi:cellulose synthase/poly-beta-1,6-N-acetylglucosamine synthase-like glycosyltransferase|uniref:glycosyltransferase n=1 Tax=Sulfuricurvum sp. PD_MW2 TaxID=2027917 RepID=UPI000C06513A|nr:glycosyltransferase [Sulfuricurvum sp. PD_MW2]PHM16441.1 MAG: glycosyl transferase family 2 [Sulfuricurvum sp. PD_MW2]